MLSAFRRGSSWPVLADVGDERLVVKLRGTAHGTLPLVAEMVVGELADVLGLATPARRLVEVPEAVPSDDPHQELGDLLRKSRGINLGFSWLDGFRDVTTFDAARIRPELAAEIVWLDALVQNPDRTPRNTNLMIKAGQVWLIDHGAALTFQHDFSQLTEQTPREPGSFVEQHLLRVSPELLAATDAELSPRLTRDVLSHALDVVPDTFLASHAGGADISRLRAAYVAFLWKRLRAPRPFINPGQTLPFQFGR